MFPTVKCCESERIKIIGSGPAPRLYSRSYLPVVPGHKNLKNIFLCARNLCFLSPSLMYLYSSHLLRLCALPLLGGGLPPVVRCPLAGTVCHQVANLPAGPTAPVIGRCSVRQPVRVKEEVLTQK